MNADGSNKVRLTNNSTMDLMPVWSTDGTKIAFVSDSKIYVMDSDGSNQQVRYPYGYPGMNSYPMWVPPEAIPIPTATAKPPPTPAEVQNPIKPRQTLRAGAFLSVSHSPIAANQDLTISGSGFTEGGGVCVDEGNITLNNVPLEIDDPNDCPASILIAAGASEGILLTNDGTFTLTVRVHDVDGSTLPLSTALLTGGIHELKVIDTNGTEGKLFLTIPHRTIHVTPFAARPGDVVTITGLSFIGNNPDGLSVDIEVAYVCGLNSTLVTTSPDVSADFQVALIISSSCPAPSFRLIRAEIRVTGLRTGVVHTISHELSR